MTSDSSSFRFAARRPGVVAFSRVCAASAAVALFGATACGGSSQQTTTTNGSSTVVSDALERYNNAKQKGTGIDLCVQAREVAAAYRQVEDEENYKLWKETESTDCGAVGMRPQG